jgi:hypothetical protein
MKLVQERAGKILELIILANDFPSRIQMDLQLREKINKWNYIKLKASAQ